ncbi:hypothetical protein MB02_10230 [Croceicoccus estronivorus]|uniref:helix-turn-helix domain-containing protein n=1 Tax=Croceicoccus estronivorus TaxID=1172626 RepID=UPI0008345A3B|nr:AraC family transcriptional regulator [Croceicoccus estronivorus]OCC23548.1 hypothetical protein MB02_10230 [Croceicoccus estronivorus]
MAAELLIDRYARAFLESAAKYGLSRDALCSRPVVPGGRYGPMELAEISRKAKLVSGDEFAGLTPNAVRAGSFELMCEMATLSSTLEDALCRAFRFYSVVTSDVSFRLESEGVDASILMTIETDSSDPHHVLGEWWLLFWHRFSQWLTGEEVVIEEIEFPHQPEVDVSAYCEVMGSSIRFGARQIRLSFPVVVLDRPVVRDLEDLKTFLTPTSVDLANEGRLGLAEALRVKLQAHLQRDQRMPKLEVLAEEFGMCGQTVRRRLEAKGLSYRELKAEVRRKVAMRCLKDGDMPIREVSQRAGFAEPNGLSRAIRSWTGVSPSSYRAMLASGQMSTGSG